MILQCAGLLGGGTALSASGLTVTKSIAKHIAAMTNVSTLKTCLMGDTDAFPATVMVSALQPFGLARAARHKHRPEGAGSPRQDSLVGHPLICSQRRLRREQIRRDISVLVG